jgi:hypothetical protein
MTLYYAIPAAQEVSTKTTHALVKNITFSASDTRSVIKKVAVAVMTEEFVQKNLAQGKPFK